MVRVAALLVLLSNAVALILGFGPVAVTPTSPYRVLRVGLLRDATVELEFMGPDTTSFVVSLFTAQNYVQYHDLSLKYTSFLSMMCAFPAELRWDITGSMLVAANVSHTDEYILMVLNCNRNESHSVEVEGSLTFYQNHVPYNVRHLTLQALSYPACYVLFSILYAASGMVWLAVLWSKRQHSNAMQWALAVPIIAKAAACTLLATAYSIVGSTGSINSFWQAAASLSSSCADGSFQVILLAWSLGWCYTTDRLPRKEVILIAFFAAWYLAFAIFFVVSGTESVATTSFTMDVLRMCTGITIFSVSAREIAALRAQVEFETWTPAKPRAYATFVLYQRIRWCFLAYLTIPLLFGWIPAASNDDWMNARMTGLLVDEIPQGVVFAIICLLVYPTEHSDFELLQSLLQQRRVSGREQILAFLQTNPLQPASTHVDMPEQIIQRGISTTADNVGLLNAEIEMVATDTVTAVSATPQTARRRNRLIAQAPDSAFT